ncbi:hypothetical protein [Streptomyces sp. NPDC059743]|uniref:hypothetical protein n=1 Tax=Streptomyces sp. NPDC059743 TaxID=3346928 RepID=UPI003657800E
MSGGNAHIGNVAEYNRQFFPAQFRSDHLRSWDIEGHHYAGLALFYSADPGPVFLPLRFDRAWLDMQRSYLHWPHVSLHWTAGEPGLSDVLAADPAAVATLRAALDAPGGGHLLAWGETAGTERLRAAVSGRPTTPGGGPAQERGQAAFESKREAHRRFSECARGRPEILITRQEVYGDAQTAAAALAARATAGAGPVMLKSDFGVGGFGTRLVRPDEIPTQDDVWALLRALTDDDAIFGVVPLLVEEYIEPHPLHCQLTYDGEITDDGVIDRGTALMHVTGTHYRGATTGPGALPEPLRRPVTDFGRTVGAMLAAEGYRGWFDVDFVRARDGRLAPTEINARRTGPCAAMAIAANLGASAGRPVVVRTEDTLPLPRAIPEERLYARFETVARVLADQGVAFVPTLVTASSEKVPYAGFALAGASVAEVDTAMRHVVHLMSGLAEEGEA